MPSSAALLAGLALLLARSSAQEVVWSSAAYLFHGERTPLYAETYPALTPVGAQQMFSQGSMFRARYLGNSSFSAGQNAVTTHAPINGIQTNALDNTQLVILSTTDEYVTASAMAFMQGLYPPKNQTFALNNGGLDSAIFNHTIVDYPLDGYQYPNIQTLSILDPTSPWIDGNVACTQYQESALDFRNDAVVLQVYHETLNFYQTLWETAFEQAFARSKASFFNAYDVYEYALYESNHNPQLTTVVNASELAALQNLAATQQRDLNGNLTVSGKYEGDMIRAISGRMLAGEIVALLKSNIASNGNADKLNLMFGSFEPFIAFFALSNLVNGVSAGTFENLPAPGAAMIFELYSVGHNASVYPNANDLWVRFLYRPSADADEPFTQYGLFGAGPSDSDMRFEDFVAAMESIAIGSIAGWCDECDAVNLFCAALNDDAGGGGGSSPSSGGATSGGSAGTVTPAVAGVIGAVTTLAVVGLAAVVAVVLGGVRLHRRDDEQRRSSTLGGFKGAEKMASDADLAVAKGGSRHERVGSWELRDGTDKSSATATVVTPVGAVFDKDTAVSASHMKNIDDDAISDLGAFPVHPRESV